MKQTLLCVAGGFLIGIAFGNWEPSATTFALLAATCLVWVIFVHALTEDDL